MPGIAGKANLPLVFEGVKAAYNRGLKNQKRAQFAETFTMGSVPVETIAMVGNSTGSAETYPLLTDSIVMREWIGERLVHALGVQGLRVVNRKFEATAGIKVDDINDGNSLMVQMAVFETMGEEAQALWVDLLVDALVANDNWVDGAAFFGTTRAFKAGRTIVNKTTSALSATTFAAAVLAMQSYIGYNGKPMGIYPTHLVFGPKLRETAHAIIKSEKIETGSAGATIANPNFGLVEGAMCNRLIGDYDDYWFLVAAGSAMKPALIQKREETGIVSKASPTDDNVFFDDEIIWGAKSRGAAALILPQLIYAGIL